MQRFCIVIFRGGGDSKKGFQPTLVDMIMTYSLRTHVYNVANSFEFYQSVVN